MQAWRIFEPEDAARPACAARGHHLDNAHIQYELRPAGEGHATGAESGEFSA
jgi:hypothetical protein